MATPGKAGAVIIYLDATALVPMVVSRPESDAMTTYINAHRQDRFVTSVISRMEVLRTVGESGPDSVRCAKALLDCCNPVPLENALIDNISLLSPGQTLSLAEMIHLGTAFSLRESLQAFVTVDPHLRANAHTWKLPTWSPAWTN